MVIVKIRDFARIMGYQFFFFEMGASRIIASKIGHRLVLEAGQQHFWWLGIHGWGLTAILLDHDGSCVAVTFHVRTILIFSAVLGY